MSKRASSEHMGKIILVVDDYEDARGFMKLLLESYGYEVIEAIDGIEAINNFKQFHPDLILMDISMPLMDGLTATRTIRGYDDGENIPIIAVSAFGKLYQKRAMEAGCNCLIDKPIDFDELEPVIDQYLMRQKSRTIDLI